MDLIDSKEQFKTLIKKYKKKGTLTNCLLPSADAYSDMIKKGKLKWEEYPLGMAIYIDEGNYYRLLYFIDPQSRELPDFKNYGKPILIEEIDTKNRREKYIEEMIPLFEKRGFRLESKNYQFAVENTKESFEKYKKISEESKAKLAKDGYRAITNLNEKQAAQVIELWKENLKVTDIPEDHLHFMEDENQRIVAIVDEKDNICAEVWWGISNKICEVRHIVTHPGHLRKHLGSIMFGIQLYSAFKEGCTGVYSFVEEHNFRSFALLEYYGIYRNDKTCYQLIKAL